MIKQNITNQLIRQPKFQYPFYWSVGAVKQFKYLFSSRNISYTGKQPFLLIVGSGRSGNTLLRKLLMENGNIYIPPESYVFSQEVITHLNAYALSWSDKVELTLAKIEFYPEFSTFGIDTLREFAIYAKKFNKEKQQIGTLIMELYQWIAEKKGYSFAWLGDKTPLNTLHLGLIKKLFPNAMFIFIERDGADVCYSYIHSGIYSSIELAAHRWKNSRIAWQVFKKTISQDSYIEIKYETLVENHEQEIKRILDKFKIPVNKKEVNINITLGDVAIRKHYSNVAKAPHKESIGKGRRLLNKHDRATLKLIIGNDLENAGYKSL